MFSAFNPSKCTHLEQWAADCAAPGEQSWTSCRSRDSNPQPWVTSGFKANDCPNVGGQSLAITITIIIIITITITIIIVIVNYYYS